MSSGDETGTADDEERPVTFEAEDYEWDDPGGPPDGTYVADFVETLDGPAPDTPPAPSLHVYDVRDGEATQIGTAVVRTGDVPELVPGANAFEVEIRGGRFVDIRYDERLNEERTGGLDWVRERFDDGAGPS